MKIFVTGATGLVGAHTTRALLDAGHQVRLLVRREQAARDYFAQHAHVLDDIVVADMRDKGAITPALADCDAVVHAAASVCLDPTRANETYRNNVDGMNAVIGTACDRGIKRIVYVSSLTALFDPTADVLNEHMPLADCHEAYSRSKRDSDLHVRRMQQQGLPIRMTYPAAIFGPDDPGLSEANHGLVQFLTKVFPRTSSGMQCVDVRDVALAHRLLLEQAPDGDPTSERYILGGHFHPWDNFHSLLQRITGKRIFSARVPGPVFRSLGILTDGIRKVVDFQTDITREAMSYITQWPPADSSRIMQATGMQFRSGEQTFSDAIAWLAQAGHITPSQAGRLASQQTTTPQPNP